MPARAGRDALFDVLASEGVHHIFGNPGTTELPLIDALVDHPEVGYVLALQEATVVAMADGYAQATDHPAFVNVHTMAGLGNAIGNLTNAMANRAPLVVTAGNADRRHLVAEPLLSGDLVGLVRATVKWAHEVRHPEELGTVLRRAFADAATPPAGPVFVAIPQDILDQPSDAPVPARSNIHRDSVAGGLDELAILLTEPEPGKVAIVAGEEVASSGAAGALVAVAERLGAPVYGAPLLSVLPFPPTHGLWAGPLAPRADAIRATLAPFERVLVVGDQAFLVYPYAPGSPLPEGTELLHLAAGANAPGHTHPARWGASGGIGASLEALLPLLAERPTAKAALSAAADRRAADIASFEERARSRYGQLPMQPMAAVHALLRSAPDGVTVVDEAITAGAYVRGLHHGPPGSYYFSRGGGLGWGMPAACGISLAVDRRPVLCAVGDGSAMYSPQALWTAAREQLPVVFAVLQNGRYQILKDNLLTAKGRAAATGEFVGIDLDDPVVDYVALAQSMGVAAQRVTTEAEVASAAAEAFASATPTLLELPIEGR